MSSNIKNKSPPERVDLIYNFDMDKIEKIQNLSIESLKDAVTHVLMKMNYEDFNVGDKYITARKGDSISMVTNLFVFNDIKMSGPNVSDDVKKELGAILSSVKHDIITLVSQYHISKGFQDSINSDFAGIRFLGRDELIKLIDEHYDIFWRHDDIELLDYELQYRNSIHNENQLKRLHIASDKYEKLIKLYIQPTLLTDEEDIKTHTLHRKRVSIENLMSDKRCALINGISGSGKSTLLQKIGLNLLDQNDKKEGKKHLPIYLTATDILASCRNVNNAILAKISFKKYAKLHEVVEDYDVTVLIDSIDEFEEKDRDNILRVLINNYENKKIKFYLASRYTSLETSQKELKGKVAEYSISKFNDEQIKRFVTALLPNQDKANTLMESLRENKILEKLPITPLTLSLITIIYEEKDYEVPATITDIYRQFNTVINGRATVSTKFDYIDINFRERILSVYALYLMEAENHNTMTRTQFISYFKDFYEDRSLTFDYEQLSDVLDYILDNTGVLYVKENGHVCFAHDSYMEFYAAVEIFNYHREKEQALVDNFFDVMWQNCAVFYAGMTKDMASFAKDVNEKLKKGSKFNEYIAGVQGAGYLSQALYMTDNIVRKQLILTALDMVLETNEFFKKMTTINKNLLQNFKLPIIQMLNFLHFYEMFNSLTLKSPITLAFDELRSEYEHILADNTNHDQDRIPALGYKLIELAFTLDSKRLNDSTALEYLLEQKSLLSDSNLYALVDLSLMYLNKKNYSQLRAEVERESVKIKPLLSVLGSDATGKIRFSPMDTIHPNRKIKIFVEGKTDAIIIEHAYMTLTGGRAPYWNIAMATQNGTTGSSSAVSSVVESSINYQCDYDCVIGLYDHDNAGLTEFGYFTRDYDTLENRCIKKRKNANTYLLCMPIPGEMIQYNQEKQEFNFFEIEHYFGHDYLRAHNMLKSQETLPDVYEIQDGRKVQFANDICKETDSKIFQYFKDLFEKIDKITGAEIDYIL